MDIVDLPINSMVDLSVVMWLFTRGYNPLTSLFFGWLNSYNHHWIPLNHIKPTCYNPEYCGQVLTYEMVIISRHPPGRRGLVMAFLAAYVTWPVEMWWIFEAPKNIQKHYKMEGENYGRWKLYMKTIRKKTKETTSKGTHTRAKGVNGRIVNGPWLPDFCRAEAKWTSIG
jgi:hypothetical protein